MLKVENVTKSFGKKLVLKNITFSIDEGETVALIGGNGSGKTTLFKIISDLLEPDEGFVRFEGEKIELVDLAYLPEDRCLYYDCTVYDQLKLICDLNKMNEEEIDYWLERVGLVQEKRTQIFQLSKGNQQKIAMITCLIKDARILILDEPFTGLDTQNIELFDELIREFIDERKIILISSHIYESINRQCDRYLILKEGNIIINITKKELHQRPVRTITVPNEIELSDYQSVYLINQKKRYIYENEEKALKVLRSLNRQKISDYEYSHLTIEDMVKIYE